MRIETEYWRVSILEGPKSLEQFNESHATEIGTEFIDDGLRRPAALELLNRWNMMSSIYKYYLSQ